MPYQWSWQPALEAHHFAARAKLYTQDYLLLQKKIASAHYNKQQDKVNTADSAFKSMLQILNLDNLTLYLGPF